MNNRSIFVKKISPTETMKRIGVGQSVLIKTRDIKRSSLESAKRRLNQQGYSFTVSEEGLIDEVKVTRSK